MRGRLCEQRRRLTALGVVLCLLAAVFAFEAKLGWFSPAGSPPAQISSAKLQPADAPRLLAEALTAPASLQLVSAEALLLVVFTVSIATVAPFRGSVRDGVRAFGSPSFSPPLFLRPPPQY
jgi:hypothetical protein